MKYIHSELSNMIGQLQYTIVQIYLCLQLNLCWRTCTFFAVGVCVPLFSTNVPARITNFLSNMLLCGIVK